MVHHSDSSTISMQGKPERISLRLQNAAGEQELEKLPRDALLYYTGRQGYSAGGFGLIENGPPAELFISPLEHGTAFHLKRKPSARGRWSQSHAFAQDPKITPRAPLPRPHNN